MSRYYLSICMPMRFWVFRADLCSPRAITLFIRRVCLFTVELGYQVSDRLQALTGATLVHVAQNVILWMP